MAATSGPDVLIGTDGADTIRGGGGGDAIYGHKATDTAATAGIIHATRVGTGFDGAVFAGAAPGDDGHLYVVTKDDGRIHRLDPKTGQSTVFLDIPDGELRTGGEQGLLGLAFHPDYASNGRFFVHMVNAAGDIEIREYRRSAADPARADAAGEAVIAVPHPDHSNHNGGALIFGPDGYLYVAIGDGGGANDPRGNAQNKNVLLGKILRLDVDAPADPGKNYAIPDDNPFAGATGADEIWAYGLRNPWRISFDGVTGDLYIGDVGQQAREEIDFQPAGSPGGENYGWDRAEGSRGDPPAGSVLPIFEYGRDLGNSVTGGHVYRGAGPALVGSYVFADFGSGRVWTLRVVDGEAAEVTERTDQLVATAGSLGSISSFGVDASGELYIVTLGGGIFRIETTALSGDVADTLRGNSGKDRLYGGAGADGLHGGSGRDLLRGGFGDDLLKGGNGRDRLKGDDGADTLAGGKGRDKLKGGAGDDAFFFSERLERKNVDEIKDFVAGEDLIVLDGRVFRKIGDAVTGQSLGIGREADDGTDRLIYDDRRGKLFYDKDGDGAGERKLVARLDKGLDLDDGDFMLA